MASTLLEETRQLHEDVERLERLIVKDFKAEAKTHKDKLMQAHRVRAMLDSVQDKTAKLVSAPIAAFCVRWCASAQHGWAHQGWMCTELWLLRAAVRGVLRPRRSKEGGDCGLARGQRIQVRARLR